MTEIMRTSKDERLLRKVFDRYLICYFNRSIVLLTTEKHRRNKCIRRTAEEILFQGEKDNI